MDTDPEMSDNNNVEKESSEEPGQEAEEKGQEQELEQEKEEVEEDQSDCVLVKIPPPPPPPPSVKAPEAPELVKMNGEVVVETVVAPAPASAFSSRESLKGSIFPVAVSPAAERIRFILGEEDDGPAPPQLFTELDELLSVDGQDMEWKETAR